LFDVDEDFQNIPVVHQRQGGVTADQILKRSEGIATNRLRNLSISDENHNAPIIGESFFCF
jgi:hypothetical protein